MSLTIADLFASPDHYLHSFEGDAALFVPMNRDAYHRSIFLDRRISPASDQQMRLPAAALAGQVPRPAATGWIFHIAHCGSTLLARALDRPAENLVLREPLALRQLALQPDSARLALTAAMISKRYHAARPTIVKANVPVNFLLPDLAAIDDQSRSIFLYLGLRDYLLAILRDEQHRQWLRGVTGQLVAYLGDLAALTDAQRGAALWHAQVAAFAGAIERMPYGRSLDAETFFAEPAALLKRAAEHLEVPMTEDEAGSVAQGPLFSTYSKNPQVAFDNAARVARREQLARALDPEIEEACEWLGGRGDEAMAALASTAL